MYLLQLSLSLMLCSSRADSVKAVMKYQTKINMNCLRDMMVWC